LLKLDCLLLYAILQGLRDPLAEMGEMFADLELNLFGKAGQFGTEESGDAEGFGHGADADLPIIDILLQAMERQGDMLVQSGMGLLHAKPVSLQDGDHKGGLGGEVMMDARLANLDGLRDVGITEG